MTVGMTRAAILGDALDAVSHDRNQYYGSPEDNFQDIADLWNIQFSQILSGKFEAHHVAQAMIHVKQSRLKTSPDKGDHYVDIAGYAACGGQAYSVKHDNEQLRLFDVVD